MYNTQAGKSTKTFLLPIYFPVFR